MLNHRSQQMQVSKLPMTSQAINPIEEDTKILSNIDCSGELLQFSRPQQPPSYSEQYAKKKTQQKEKEQLPPSSSASFPNKPKKKVDNSTDRSALLISTSQDKILSPKTSYNFIPRSNSQKKMTENNKSQLVNCSEVNYTNYNNSTNTTCVYSSAEGYWQRRSIEKRKKMDRIRDLNYQREQNEMRDRPNISKNSQLIVSHLRSKSNEKVFDRLSSGVDVRKKSEDIKNIEMRTRENRQPVINQSSQRLQRTINDLYQWKVQIERKRLENQTVTNCSFDPTPLINGESEDILKERKPDYLRKRVEDRLIEQGEITKIKKEEKKEHYHDRLMAPNEEKKCYMTTCPSKRTAAKSKPQQNQPHSQLQPQPKTMQRNSSDKKYIQKSNNMTPSQHKESNSSNKRSTSGRLMKYSNDNHPQEMPKQPHQLANTRNPNQTGLYYDNRSNKLNDPNFKSNPNKPNQDIVNLSNDIINNPMIQQQPSPFKNPGGKPSTNDSNLLEIRKHLNDYYEQKTQQGNKSFSYKQNNTSQGKVSSNAYPNKNQITSQPQALPYKALITNNNNDNVRMKNQLQKSLISQPELEEDKIINQIPQNEPQVKYQPVTFQEEEQWIPCGKDNNHQPIIYSKPNYASNSSQFSREQKPIDYSNYQRNGYDSNSCCQQEQPNQYYHNQQPCNNYQSHMYSQENSPLKQSCQSLHNDDQPKKYNFNQEIFNRFTPSAQEQDKEKFSTINKPQPQAQPRQYYTLSPEIDNIPSSRYEVSSQSHLQQHSSIAKYKDDNPLSKYRDETSKRLQDLEQMQQFSNNLRQSNEMSYERKQGLNQPSQNPMQPQPRSQISNAIKADDSSNQLTDNMSYLNDRLKLNEQSKNFLYAKMNQISPYQSSVSLQSNDNNTSPYQSSDQNLNGNVNAFEFQRKKL